MWCVFVCLSRSVIVTVWTMRRSASWSSSVTSGNVRTWVVATSVRSPWPWLGLSVNRYGTGTSKHMTTWQGRYITRSEMISERPCVSHLNVIVNCIVWHAWIKYDKIRGGMEGMNCVTDILSSLLAFQVFVKIYERCFMLTYKGHRHNSCLLLWNSVTLSISLLVLRTFRGGGSSSC